MEALKLNLVAEWCHGRLLNASPALVVDGVSTDSRAIKAGELFIALSGDKFDAHDFLADVNTKGAAAALVNEARVDTLPAGLPAITVDDTRKALGRLAASYRQQFGFPIVAIAGSNGKTSTKELVASVVSERLNAAWSPASFNNDIGVPLTLLQLTREHQVGVLEIGTNHPGELRPLIEMIRPTIGIVTSIGREHLEFFGSLEGVLEEEGTLAEMLPKGGLLIINGDGYGAGELTRRTAARVARVGVGSENEWRIREVELGAGGSRFLMECDAAAYAGEYHIKLLGSHQVVNAAYAVVVGKELGLGRAEIQRGLASCSGAKMRLQPKRIDDFLVLDDAYNANADSMQAALETLHVFPCKGRRIAVLGDMGELGDTSDSAHEEVGRRAAEKGVDCLVAVGKSSGLMAQAARTAGLRTVLQLPEVENVGPAVTELVRPGDVVLVKASRSARLERVIEYLSAQFGEKEPAKPGK
ncbi:MAG TPA: UDP-N-acetylmuramoyl-tripeptide--D-alanyl-D-alanine ligase [Verrucomicrobiae bacterium]